MIAKTHIVPSLQALDVAYRAAPSADDAERFAKLSIIELCGWIEESMDALILRCAKRNLKVTDNLDYCEEFIVKKTYGFHYKKHFRIMLVRLIGLISVERLENQVDQIKHDALKNTLKSLEISRNLLAHTHLKGTARAIDAPSVTISKFQYVYDGLVDIDKMMRRAGW